METFSAANCDVTVTTANQFNRAKSVTQNGEYFNIFVTSIYVRNFHGQAIHQNMWTSPFISHLLSPPSRERSTCSLNLIRRIVRPQIWLYLFSIINEGCLVCCVFDWIALWERVQLVSSGNKLTLTALCIQWSLSCIKTHLYPHPSASCTSIGEGFAFNEKFTCRLFRFCCRCFSFLYNKRVQKNVGCVNFIREFHG